MVIAGAIMELRQVPPELLAQLLTLTRDLTAGRELDVLLHHILEGSTTLIPGADFACVFLYQPEDNALVPVGGIGFDMRHMKDVWIKPGESLTGKAFVERMPLLLPNPQSIRQAQSNLTPEHAALVRRAVGRPENPVRSSLAVPLMVGPRTVGVLVIDNYDTDRDFDEVDLAVATSLADHAAVAVLNAEDYQRAKRASSDLREMARVQRLLMACMSSPDASVKKLGETLGAILRKPLAIYDDDQRLLMGYGDRVPDPEEFIIQTGTEVLGRLIMGRGPAGGREQTVVEQALPLIAIEMMKTRALEAERHRVERDAFRGLWKRDPLVAENFAKTYGLERSDWQALVIANLDGPRIKALDEWTREKNVPYTWSDDAAILVVVKDRITSLLEWLAPLSVHIYRGSFRQGAVWLSQEIRGVVTLWRIAPTGLDLHHEDDREIFLEHYPELLLLDTVPGDTRQDFVDKLLAPIAQDSVLIRTIATWMRTNRSYDDTAALLHTHPNTIRYRLEKASQLLGHSLTEDRFLMQLRLAFFLTVDVHL